MGNQHSKIVFALLAGAAAGLAIGYYLAADNKEEMIEDLKTAAGKVKEEMETELEKGKNLLTDLKDKFSDLMNKA